MICFSADQDWMNYLVHKKLINSSSVHPVLLNQLVAISPKHLNIHFKPQSSFNFAQSFKGYVCTGQMESVPAGKYTKQSLTKLNWLNGLKGRIVERMMYARLWLLSNEVNVKLGLSIKLMP